MDSNGSFQSSSGGGDAIEYDSLNHLTQLPPPLLDHHTYHQTTTLLFEPPPPNPLFHPLTSTHQYPTNPNKILNPNLNPNLNPSSLINLESVQSQQNLRSDPTPTAPTTTTTKQSTIPTSQSPSHHQSNQPVQGGGISTARNPKKRTRASRRGPTTVLTTDTSNFRAMVQEFTGIPSPPPFSGSPFARMFGSSSGFTIGSSLYPLRASPQKLHQYSPPSSLINNSISIEYQQNQMMSLQNQVLSLQHSLQQQQQHPQKPDMMTSSTMNGSSNVGGSGAKSQGVVVSLGGESNNQENNENINFLRAFDDIEGRGIGSSNLENVNCHSSGNQDSTTLDDSWSAFCFSSE